ncbi:MAG: dolichol kinase [Candidatus Thermoplasmatota archaeon]
MQKTMLLQKTEKLSEQIHQKINEIQFDAHWFRRIFHTSAASVLVYYVLPEALWIQLLKIIIPVWIVVGVTIIEYLRLRSIINNDEFFGLRPYEYRRPASYWYFSVALVILLLGFPQQIAIPCILCASFTDPIMGEIRIRFGVQHSIGIGFFLSFIFYSIIWYTAQPFGIGILTTSLGAGVTVLSESLKNPYLDDDFLMQILPAICIGILYLSCWSVGMNILPKQSLIPLSSSTLQQLVIL